MHSSSDEQRRAGMTHAHEQHAAGEHAQGGRTSVKDPVCGMDVERGQAAGGSAEYTGATYWFCNPGCREKFAADPARYVAPPSAALPAATPSTGPLGDTRIYTCPM